MMHTNSFIHRKMTLLSPKVHVNVTEGIDKSKTGQSDCSQIDASCMVTVLDGVTSAGTE